MTADRSAGSRSPGAVQETAQALVASGELAQAVKLMDRYLSEFDGDWGMWLYFAGLCARLGKRDESVAAYRACARQLEGDGHFARARDALISAVRVMPRDEALKRELDRVGRLSRRPQPPLPKLPPPDPAQQTMLLPVLAAPRGRRSKRPPDPAQETMLLPVIEKKPAPRSRPLGLPDPAVHLTAVIPGRRSQRTQRPPSSPELTDPYCAIFDILDAERSLR